MRGMRAAVRRFITARLDRESYLGLHVTIGFLVTALTTWLFGALLEDVLEQSSIVQWDQAASAWVHSRATPSGLLVFRVLTWLGEPIVIGAISVVAIVALWRQQRRTVALTWIAAWLGGALFNQVLKTAVGRERPEFGRAFLFGDSYSFPSGHSMGSIVVYGMLAFVVATRWRPGGMPRGVVYALAVVVVLAVGASRIYMGVHFPTDVVGGLSAGAAWLAICLTGLHVAEGRRRGRG